MVFQDMVKCEVNEHIATVTINNPPVNALNVRVMDGIEECFKYLLSLEDLRAVIVTGEGKAFVAGADIKEFTALNGETSKASTLKGHRIFTMIETLPAPTIAAINGFALGGGLELALSCDIRIASEKARLGLPETGLGIIPGYGGTAKLAKYVNIGQAKKMIFTAEHITARDAERIGLVQEVTAPEELMKRAGEIALKISGNAPIAVRQAKLVVNASRDLSFKDSLTCEAEAVPAGFSSQDKVEGVDAFINKRQPMYKNK